MINGPLADKKIPDSYKAYTNDKVPDQFAYATRRVKIFTI